MRILLVDDDDMVRALFKKMLEKADYDVTTKSNVPDAVESLKDNSFDLLISDVIMPHIDGTHLMRFAKEEYPSMPVIAITGGLQNTQTDHKNCTDFFADHSFEKPIRKDELLRFIDQIFA